MTDIKVGDVVVHREPGGPKYTGRMLFYVDGLNYGGGDKISLRQITTQTDWHLGLPADELVVVGHVGEDFVECLGRFTPEDMATFEPARQEALKQGVPLRETWTR